MCKSHPPRGNRSANKGSSKKVSHAKEISHTKIPHGKITSWNARALSMHRTDPSGRARRIKTFNTISRLLARCDILCLQETRLGTNDQTSLKTQFNDKYIIYYENDILGHGGTLTLVSRKFARDYNIEQIHLGDAAKGRILPLMFNPKSNLSPTPPLTPLPSLCVVNVYLTAGAGPTTRHREFEELGKLDPTSKIVLCGDFNFVEVPSDAPSSTSDIILTGNTYDKWCDLVEKLNLKEVFQPTHTCYSITKSLHTNRTSRIDRFYINHTESELSLLHPTSFIPYLGFCSVDRTGPSGATEGLEPSGHRMNRSLKSFVSDHVPISLNFHSTSKNGGKRGGKVTIPSWYPPGRRERQLVTNGPPVCRLDKPQTCSTAQEHVTPPNSDHPETRSRANYVEERKPRLHGHNAFHPRRESLHWNGLHTPEC